jgi:hypothetical protein
VAGEESSEGENEKMKMGKIGMMLASAALLAGSVFAGQEAAPSADVSSISVPAGTALTEGEIIILLQAKVPVEVIQKFVHSRGVSFSASKETGRKIIAAGGNVALVGTISLNQKEQSMAQAAPEDNKRKK